VAHYDALGRLLAMYKLPRTRENAMELAIGEGRTLGDWNAEDELEMPPDLRVSAACVVLSVQVRL
jgi:hypothetical protein